jgi:hypothetical protein
MYDYDYELNITKLVQRSDFSTKEPRKCHCKVENVITNVNLDIFIRQKVMLFLFTLFLIK